MKGFRIIALAFKDIDDIIDERVQCEQDLIFAGF